MSASELHALLSSGGVSIGLTTVYRALHDLERAGHVDVVRDEAGGRFYRQRPAAGHRHYLICRCCGLSRAVDTDIVERWAERLAADSGFADIEHALELVGVCADCLPTVTEGEPPCRQASRDRPITGPAETDDVIQVYGNDNRYHFHFRSKIGRLVNRRLLALPAAVAAVTVGLTACSSGSDSPGAAASGSSSPVADATIKVVASTNVWGDLAGSIGGDKVQVTSIITSPDADPHEYEASTRNQLALAKATVVIENGGGYDDFIDRMLKSAKNPSATVLNAVTISGKKAAGGAGLNEHVWYDFPTVEKVVDQIEQVYAQADPGAAATFQQNADALKQKIAGLVQQEATLKQKYDGQPAAITEPVPLYLLDAVGLQNKTPEAFSKAIEEDSDVPAKVLNDTLALYSSHQVKVLAYNAQTTGPATEKVLNAAKQNGVPVVPVTETLPAGKDYVGWMSANLDALGAALGQ